MTEPEIPKEPIPDETEGFAFSLPWFYLSFRFLSGVPLLKLGNQTVNSVTAELLQQSTTILKPSDTKFVKCLL